MESFVTCQRQIESSAFSYEFSGIETTDSNCYQTLISKFNPPLPNKTTEFNGRLQDFLKRGTNMRQSRQVSLGEYYQWLLCNYGDQLLDAVGTLEFTDPDLVPNALIQGL